MQCVHAIFGVSSFLVNSPGKHVLHSPFPVSSWYCPLWQFRQTVAAAKEYFPATQVGSHVDAVVAAVAVEYLPGIHPVQSALPVYVLYLPATHCVHVPPSGPEEPALQMQFVETPLPANEYEFVGQSPHVSDAAPTVVEYFPTPQSVQTTVPVDVLYLPATHCVHTPPFGPDAPLSQMQFVEAPLPASDEE